MSRVHYWPTGFFYMAIIGRPNYESKEAHGAQGGRLIRRYFGAPLRAGPAVAQPISQTYLLCTSVQTHERVPRGPGQGTVITYSCFSLVSPPPL
uniref:Uncharacterized protein n=1 Tax=Anguilla anguilla TaxID=7936 RepID=A0A0E9TA88_ANGAN